MNYNTAKSLRPALCRFLAVLVLLALTLSLSCGSASAMVQISDKYYITDEAGVISETTEDYIAEQNGFLEANCEGAQIAVVVVDFLDGMDIEDYCYQLFDDMDLGSASEDNGVLLLLTIGEENYWCMQGTGLINSLSSGTIDDILYYYLEPDFAAGNYDAGVRTVFDALYNELCSIYGVSGNGAGAPSVNDGYYDGSQDIQQIQHGMRMMRTITLILTIVTILFIMFTLLYIYTVFKKNSARQYSRPSYHPVPGPHPGHVHPAPRPRRRRFVI